MDMERRQSPRAKPYELVYVSLSPQNRGLIIDATEDGVQFLAEGPVKHDLGMLPARFTLNPLEQIETVGEIIWLDESNRAGGLRFTNLAAPERANIREWLAQNAQLLPPRVEAVDLQNNSNEADGNKWNDMERMDAPENDLAGQNSSAEATDEASRAGIAAPASEFAVPWRSSVPAAPRGSQRGQRTNVSRHRARTIAIVMLGLAVAATAVLAILFHWQIAERTKLIGQNLLNWVASSSSSSASSSPADTHISPLLQPPSSSRPTRQIAGGGDSDFSPSRHEPGEAELATALQYLRGDGERVQTALAVKWLWASVQKGNMKAATLLANVYEWGRGVPRNCEQARVLLIGAANRGSTEAAQQLQDMETDGCGNTASK